MKNVKDREQETVLWNLVNHCQKYQEHILTVGEFRIKGFSHAISNAKCVVMCMNFAPVIADDLTELLTAIITRLNKQEEFTFEMEEEIVSKLRKLINHVRKLRHS